MKSFKKKFNVRSENLEEFYIKNGYLLIKSPLNKSYYQKLQITFKPNLKKIEIKTFT